jgi:hypothetical protein
MLNQAFMVQCFVSGGVWQTVAILWGLENVLSIHITARKHVFLEQHESTFSR